MSDVTRITGDAGQDDLDDNDYREIYDELRQGHSLRNVVALVGVLSPSWWMQYENGSKALTWTARCGLRRAVGLPMLPVPVGEALKDVDPNAEVWKVGDDEHPDRVLLIARPGAVTVHWNGDGPVELSDDTTMPLYANVTGVTRAEPSGGSITRRKRANITVSRETATILAAAKPADETWDAWLRRLIDGR
jgi:hypothetical protein